MAAAHRPAPALLPAAARTGPPPRRHRGARLLAPAVAVLTTVLLPVPGVAAVRGISPGVAAVGASPGVASVGHGSPAAAGGTGSRAVTGHELIAGPGDDLTRLLDQLQPGDVLKLRPGTYRVGYLRPYGLHPGTASAPVTVTALDPVNRPLLQGYVRLVGADYWRLSSVRVQATIAGAPALDMDAGTGWAISDAEFFGARQTGAYANVVISSTFGAPSGFAFSGNCVHDAGVKHLWQDHNIYVNFHGTPASGGTIERNLIFNHTSGAGIKLGDGGAPRAPGPWNVTVRFNTIVNGGTQIRMFGDVRNNRIVGNLLALSSMTFSSRGRSMGMTVENVVGAGNQVAGIYVYGASVALWDPSRVVANRGDVAVRPNPRLTGAWTCTGWRPLYPPAVAYGRYGTGIFPL
ncbi:MAG TPA: right-handed parallel beta-helix repeat-containing protein [Kineosporiaceae bacterium]|nr:right-handed parallel beta-helix repeat-containing protein [Kineosporiaceae bacterium]